MIYTSPYTLAPPTTDAPLAASAAGQANAGFGVATGAVNLANRFKKSKAPLQKQVQQLKRQEPGTYFANESKFKKLARQTPRVSGFKRSLGPALQIGGAALAFTPMSPVALAAVQAGSALASKYADKSMNKDLGGQMRQLQKGYGQATAEATGQPMQRQPQQPKSPSALASDVASAASPFIRNPIAQASIQSAGGAMQPQPTQQRVMGGVAPWLNRSIYA